MLSRQAKFLELESAKLVVSANGNSCAVLQQPSLYPRQAELHNSGRIVLTLPTLNLFLAEVLDHEIVKTIAHSSLAAVSRGAIRVYS